MDLSNFLITIPISGFSHVKKHNFNTIYFKLNLGFTCGTFLLKIEFLLQKKVSTQYARSSYVLVIFVMINLASS